MIARGLALLAILGSAVACQTFADASPSPAPAAAKFEINGTWQRCHQMGACRYSVELTTPNGASTVELVRLDPGGEEGTLIAEDGLPATLHPGAHALTVVSTMYGDTIDASGNQTVLGEEARCSAAFAVSVGTTGVHGVVTLVPQSCTITVSMDAAP